MAENKVFRTIKLEELSFSQLSFICDRLGKKKSVFMKELLEQLFDIFSDLKPNSANIFYLGSGNQLIINAVGQSYLVTGSFQKPANAPDSEIDYEVRKRVERDFDSQQSEG